MEVVCSTVAEEPNVREPSVEPASAVVRPSEESNEINVEGVGELSGTCCDVSEADTEVVEEPLSLSVVWEFSYKFVDENGGAVKESRVVD